MKKVLYILTSIVLLSCSTSKIVSNEKHDNIVPFHYKKLDGIVLTKDYEIFFPGEYKGNRFTPTYDEIVKSETLLKTKIKDINTPEMINQGGNCPIIHKNLKNYFRQYSGNYNDKGEKIVNINFIWDKYTIWDKIKGYSDDRAKYREGYYFVLDGCSYYWQVSINMTTMKIEMFSVNGIALIKKKINKNWA